MSSHASTYSQSSFLNPPYSSSLQVFLNPPYSSSLQVFRAGRRRSRKQFMLERHVVFGLEANHGAEDVVHCAALFGEGVDDGGAWGCEGCLFMNTNTCCD